MGDGDGLDRFGGCIYLAFYYTPEIYNYGSLISFCLVLSGSFVSSLVPFVSRFGSICFYFFSETLSSS